LVPEAWRGRGLGNQFLNEISRADALIHVVDSSGSTDIEGKPCKPSFHNPVKDVKFLEEEFDMWLLQMISKDWDKLARKIEGAKLDLALELEKRFSGLSINKLHVYNALKKSSLSSKKPTEWSKLDLKRFVHELRIESKPMLLAANKIDVPTSRNNVKKLKDTGYVTVPCCAEAELILRKAAEKGVVKYLPGDSDFKILDESALDAKKMRALKLVREKVLKVWGSTGVQEAINKAFFKLLRMIVVYPVEDPEKLTDHRGRVLPDAFLVPDGTTAKEFAGIVHTELKENFIYAVEARSGRRVGEDYKLKNNDVISIVSAKRRV